MCTQSQNYGLKSRGTPVSLWILTVSMLLSAGPVSFAQQFPLPTGANRPEAPKPVEWVRGPATASMIGEAEIKIPDGYAFVSTEAGAGQVLRKMNYVAPPNLAGIIATGSGSVWLN